MSVLEALCIPTLTKQRVPVKTLVEQLQPTPENKRLIECHVASIYLVSLLNEQTIHYRAYRDDDYSYQAIYVLQIALKKNDQLTDLTSQLHVAFPEPTLLLMEHMDKQWVSVAPKRISKIDQTKTVLEDNVVQEINMNSMHYLNLSQITAINLKDYYTKIVQIVYKIGVLNLIKVYPTANLDYKSIIKKYQAIQTNINNLKEQYKRASMKSEKMDIDNQIYDEEMKQKNIVKRLKEGV